MMLLRHLMSTVLPRRNPENGLTRNVLIPAGTDWSSLVPSPQPPIQSNPQFKILGLGTHFSPAHIKFFAKADSNTVHDLLKIIEFSIFILDRPRIQFFAFVETLGEPRRLRQSRDLSHGLLLGNAENNLNKTSHGNLRCREGIERVASSGAAQSSLCGSYWGQGTFSFNCGRSMSGCKSC